MVVDSSALIAILQDEPERAAFNEVIEAAERCNLSTASFVETSLVIGSRYGPDGIRALDLFVAKARILLVPVDADHAHIAREGFYQYGKGRHRAALNFGDCFSYALAKALAEPLLYKGDDFTHTDIVAARV